MPTPEGWTYVATYSSEEAATDKVRQMIDQSDQRLDFTVRYTDTGRVNLYMRVAER